MTSPIASYWDLLEPDFKRINIYESPERYEESIKGIWRPVVHLYATHMCCSEVHNGGFLQLFWNGTGIAVPEAIEGFALMGMPKIDALLEETSMLLGTPYPRDRDERWDALLDASGHSSQQLETIFKGHDNFYQCFLEATKPLGFDPLDSQFWKLATEENGGFDAAATRYAISVMKTQ